MSVSSQTTAILALLTTSLIVRVAPVFVPLRLGSKARALFERVLPLAVFINFAVYILWTEIRIAPLPAIVAMSLAAIVTFATRMELVIVTILSTGVYMLCGIVLRG